MGTSSVPTVDVRVHHSGWLSAEETDALPTPLRADREGHHAQEHVNEYQKRPLLVVLSAVAPSAVQPVAVFVQSATPTETAECGRLYVSFSSSDRVCAHDVYGRGDHLAACCRFKTCLSRLRGVMRSKHCLPGGGVWQLCCASFLRRTANAWGRLGHSDARTNTAAVLEEFAESLDVRRQAYSLRCDG